MAMGTQSNTENQQHYKYLKNLTVSEKNEFLNSFDLALCDIDGVIWPIIGDRYPGVSQAINTLRSHGKKVAFVTNNSTISLDEYLKKFEKIDLKIEKDDIINPAQSIVRHLKSSNFHGLIYCIGSPALKDRLRSEGFQLAEIDENEPAFLETTQDFIKAILKDDPVKAVIIDVDLNLKSVQLMRAQIFLRDPECLFIAGANDVVSPLGGGHIIGPGQFVRIVESVSKCKAVALGKPSMDLRDALVKFFELDIQNLKRVIFIGDSLTSDIRFGNLCGFQTLLVLTGGAKATDLSKQLPAEQIPNYVTESIADLSQLS